MKKIFLVILTFLLLYNNLIAQNPYYWAEGKKYYFEDNDSKFYISYSDESLRKFLSQVELQKDIFSQGRSQNLPKAQPSYWAYITPTLMSQIKNFPLSYSSHNYKIEVKKNEGVIKYDEFGISDIFYVQLKNDKDTVLLQDYSKQFGAQILGKCQYLPHWYELCNTTLNSSTWEIANKFYETGLFLESHPNFMFDISSTYPNDSLYVSQWYLHDSSQYDIDINFCPSIATAKRNVIVAVVDEGIDTTHPDLQNFSGCYYTETQQEAYTFLGNHGTACAGIIGATKDNHIGITGIASGCSLMSIISPLLASNTCLMNIASGFMYAAQNGASVISNSWAFSTSFSLNIPILNQSINYAIQNGRNGLGCVVVFSSGNENENIAYPACVSDDILVVGALSPCGERKNPNSCDGETWWGSNFGSKLDICAPGTSIVTTNINGGYLNSFNGTSAACPQVAATAALIISRNPLLTQKEVCDIIELTAQKVGGYTYATTIGRLNGGWNEEVGYGLLDVSSAIQMACQDTLLLSNQNIISDTTITHCQVEIENVSVSNNANLIINSGTQTTINHSFYVEEGASVIIQ